ncbi:intein N-terminal splicing region [Pseudobutyrivibrio sp. YE44]|uniref:hypothetical protein n=1 Tax=Pseudobutyrivibrio sp. YE44 TaxID=1520802 RepID=UPI00088CE443|nr:hypothetical protein [Pseudobutyrivibrio sp. YE44]SDB07999.1 intein N-terminal splicing region [Pseudobutyrivibrio sp. YE44]
MIRIEHDFGQEVINNIKADYKGSNLPDVDMYGRNNANSTITIEDGVIREVIRNEEGIFKDLSTPLQDVNRFVVRNAFAFIETTEYVYCISLNGFVEGSIEEIKDLVKDKAKKNNLVSFKDFKKEKDKKNKQDIKAAWRNNSRSERVPLGQRFRIPIIFAAVFVMFTLVDAVDPLYGMMFNGMPINSMLFSVLTSALSGFAFGFVFIFFRIWFSSLSEKKKIVSIVLFPITLAVFFIISVFGTIPYIIHLLVLGHESYRLPSIINVATKIAFVIVCILVLVLFLL